MATTTEAQRRKQQMDTLLAAGAANGHSLMVLQMEDLAGLLQRLQGGLANGTQALSNSLHAQTTTIEAMATQLKAALAESARLAARVAELEKQNLGIRQFDAQVQLQARKLDHQAKTTDEMMGLIKIGAAAMLSRRGGTLGGLGELLAGGAQEPEEPSETTIVAAAPTPARAKTAPPPKAEAPKPVVPVTEVRAPEPVVAVAAIAVSAPAPAEALAEASRDEVSDDVGAPGEDGGSEDEGLEVALLDEGLSEEEKEGDEEEEHEATAPLPESLGACAELVLQRLSPSTLDRVLACTEKPNRDLQGAAPMVAVVRLILGCCDEGTRQLLHQEAGPELKALVTGKQQKGSSLGASAKRAVECLSPSTLERVLACTEKPHPQLEGGAPIVTLVRLVLGCCDKRTLALLQEEVGSGLQEHMTGLMLRSMAVR